MRSNVNCPKCGRPLPSDAPRGVCPDCMLGLLAANGGDTATQALATVPNAAIGSNATNGGPPVGGQRFGDYELLDEIARGGMGVVYRARQISLNRIVAVKMILAGRFAGKQLAQRFRGEASAAAVLQHPNIVAVHDVGVQDGQHFFSMDYVQGQNLAQLVGYRPLPPMKAAQYIKLVAEAIHYAHGQGILHRDLKPSNVLVDAATDRPRITDFGLAKRLDSEASLTVTGQVLGSPNFMPPEQTGADRGRIGRPSDVYGLGGILYYLLTARAPFQGESLEAIVTQVLHADPVSPRLLNSAVSRDLETICLKCLEKEPGRRYPTAQALADELGRFLNHEPIQARPLGLLGKARRWCQRRPALASALLLLHVVFALGLGGITWQWRRAQTGEERAQRLLYAAKMNLAQQAWEGSNAGRVRELLDETAAYPGRGFEWYYWQRQTHLARRTLYGHLDRVQTVAISTDARRIVTGSYDGTARVWDAATGQELLALRAHGIILSVAFSPDGQRIATSGNDRTARVWETASGKELLTLRGHKAKIHSVAFAPDGRRIVTASNDDTGRVWDAVTGQELFALQGVGDCVRCAEFSPDGQQIVTSYQSTPLQQIVKIWDASNGQDLRPISEHPELIWSTGFSPKGDRIFGTGSGSVWVWDVATGTELLNLRGHDDTVLTAAFSADGQRIVTASDDRTAKVWDAATGRELFSLIGHRGGVISVAYSGDGRWIVTGGRDHTARIWEATASQELATLRGHHGPVRSLAVSPDGQWIVTGSNDRTAKIWDALHARQLRSMNGHNLDVVAVAISEDGGKIATGSRDGTAVVWEAATGAKLVVLSGHDGPVHSVAFSPDGKQLVTGSADHTARVWATSSGEKRVTLEGHRGAVFSAVFSADGLRVITVGEDRAARIWNVANGEQMLSLRGHSAAIVCVAASADGRRIATGSEDETARLWDAAFGRELVVIRGHGGTVTSVGISSDSRQILTGGSDGVAKLWDARDGTELLSLQGSSGVTSVAFSRGGDGIAIGRWNGTVDYWRAASTQQVAAWQEEERVGAERLERLRREREAEEEPQRVRRRNDPGAIKEWLVLAPIPFEPADGRAALDDDKVTWEALATARAGQRVRVDGRELTWQTVHLDDQPLDLNRLLGGPTAFSVAYAVCYLKSESNRSGLLLRIGSDDQAKVLLNGVEVYRYPWSRDYSVNEDAVGGINLRAGTNPMVFKIVNQSDDWRGSVWLTDTEGQPIGGLELSLTPP